MPGPGRPYYGTGLGRKDSEGPPGDGGPGTRFRQLLSTDEETGSTQLSETLTKAATSVTRNESKCARLEEVLSLP